MRGSIPVAARWTWTRTASGIRANLAEPGRWDAFVQTTRTSHAAAEARLGEVAAPVLVVMGDHDPDFRDPAAEAAFIGARLGRAWSWYPVPGTIRTPNIPSSSPRRIHAVPG